MAKRTTARTLLVLPLIGGMALVGCGDDDSDDQDAPDPVGTTDAPAAPTESDPPDDGGGALDGDGDDGGGALDGSDDEDGG